MNKQNLQNTLGATETIGQWGVGQSHDFVLTNLDTPWIAELLEELNENFDPASATFSQQTPSLEVSINVLRRMTPAFGNHLVVRGSLKTTYLTQCVRCLVNMTDELESDFVACFTEQGDVENPLLHDTDMTVVNGEEMELHFHQNQKVDFKEFIHEQLYLHLNQLPLHDPDCKGLDQGTGMNLNEFDKEIRPSL